jgi:hypothetical protein
MTTTRARRVAIVSRRGSLPSLASSRPQPILWVYIFSSFSIFCSPNPLSVWFTGDSGPTSLTAERSWTPTHAWSRTVPQA